LIIRGISDNLDKKPRASKMAQKNSAKMTNCKDNAGPRPIGSLKVVSLSLKFSILAQPWVTSIREVDILKIANPKSWKYGVVEKNSFFMVQRFSNGLTESIFSKIAINLKLIPKFKS